MMKKRAYTTKASRGKLANEDPNSNGGLVNSGRATSGTTNTRGKRKRATGASSGPTGIMSGTVVASNPFDDDHQQHHHHHHHAPITHSHNHPHQQPPPHPHHQMMPNGGLNMNHPHSVYHPSGPQHAQEPPPPLGPLHGHPYQMNNRPQQFQSMPPHHQPQSPYPSQMHPQHMVASGSPGPNGGSMQSMAPQMASPSPYGTGGPMNSGQPHLAPSGAPQNYPTHPSPISNQMPLPRPCSQPQRAPGHLATPPLGIPQMQIESIPPGSSPHPPPSSMYGYGQQQQQQQPQSLPPPMHSSMPQQQLRTSNYSPPETSMLTQQPPPPPHINPPPVGAPSPLQPSPLSSIPPQQSGHPVMSESPAYEPTPPPPPQTFCIECRRQFYPNEFRIICRAGCDSYYHQSCSGLTELACDMLMREPNAEWACNRCIFSDRKIPVVRTIVDQTSDCRAPSMQWA